MSCFNCIREDLAGPIYRHLPTFCSVLLACAKQSYVFAIVVLSICMSVPVFVSKITKISVDEFL